MSDSKFWLLPNWYPQLAAHSFITTFVPLRPDAIELLKAGCLDDLDEEERISAQVIEDLRQPMAEITGNCFTGVDSCAPTDTKRFAAKRGSVYSPRSAWKFIRESAKVRAAAQAGLVSSIWLRPFRNMTDAREFRLFIKDGKLRGISQYHLTRHFRRLAGMEDAIWGRCNLFVSAISWRLPKEPMVMDIYFTSGFERILIVDLNPWGAPTDPLLFKWEQDWDQTPGLALMEPPTKISGDVNVSF